MEGEEVSPSGADQPVPVPKFLRLFFGFGHLQPQPHLFCSLVSTVFCPCNQKNPDKLTTLHQGASHPPHPSLPSPPPPPSGTLAHFPYSPGAGALGSPLTTRPFRSFLGLLQPLGPTPSP